MSQGEGCSLPRPLTTTLKEQRFNVERMTTMSKKNDKTKTVETADLPTSGVAQMIPFGDIFIDDELNVRKTYDKKKLASLAESIRTQGQLDPFLVGPKNKDGKYPLIAGFRRSRAHKLVHGDAAASVLVPVNVKEFRSSEEALLANMAFDEGREPIKRYELADRLAYMSSELGYKGVDLAKKINMSNATVSNIITCRTKLCDEVLAAWSGAPSPEQEIPISKLVEWAHYPTEDQLAALEDYMSAGEDEDPEEPSAGDGKGEGKGKKDKPKSAVLLKPLSKKTLVGKLTEFREREGDGDEFTDAEVGAYKTLRWVLGETKTLRLS
jgi:ParB/RepB/Spo0J family partition protein